MRITKPLLAIVLTSFLLVAGSTAAQATEANSPTQDRIDTVLAEFGGEQTAWNEVSWDDGAVVLTVAADMTLAPFAVGSCASGSFCAYSLGGYLGSRLTFSTCTSNHSVAALGGPVRSIANSRTSGTVSAYNGSSFVLSVAPNTGTNTVATITKLNCA